MIFAISFVPLISVYTPLMMKSGNFFFVFFSFEREKKLIGSEPNIFLRRSFSSLFFSYLPSSLKIFFRTWKMNTSTNNLDKVKTYLLAASGRRTIRNSSWIDDVPSESFTLPKYEVSASGIHQQRTMCCTSRKKDTLRDWPDEKQSDESQGKRKGRCWLWVTNYFDSISALSREDSLGRVSLHDSCFREQEMGSRAISRSSLPQCDGWEIMTSWYSRVSHEGTESILLHRSGWHA